MNRPSHYWRPPWNQAPLLLFPLCLPLVLALTPMVVGGCSLDLPGSSFHRAGWETLTRAPHEHEDGEGEGEQDDPQIKESIPDYGPYLLGPGMNRLRQRAEEALAEGRLTKPEESGAVALYGEMIQEDPGDYFAEEFKERLLEKLEARALDQLRRKDFLNAKNTAEAIGTMDSENRTMVHVKERVARQYRR